ncbi:MAG TPA: DUF2235 domain-containing protein [Polaromonas sp.]|uniref:DUF2235 domain-containing protein n=1 Tax=Polaromonas sp. TaxID=1869339 RepID=UPI002D26EA7C|nr:DUF2235 domain-containing protein [Polaromonas sp.]HYW55382.1 DUF2235 domain-containing protein [Polaromonas sp.]
MGKNIVIFSDGTGQAGGLRPDQKLSNIYKLYRACRSGPDSPIDPAAQTAFYDAGLGTEANEGSIPLRAVKLLNKLASSATGRGISTNITDCYEAILKHYEPGDRIFLFGFSRGAYTVRCVGGVLNLCGVPTSGPGGTLLPRYGRGLRILAEEAVSSVYEHGAGRDRLAFEPERLEKARRFRARYGSDLGGQANAVPYFIGVFDTVAALGARGVRRVLELVLLFGAVLLPCAALAGIFQLVVGYGFWPLFVALASALGLWTAVRAFMFSLKVIKDYPSPGQSCWHLAGWRSGFYDRMLSPRVRAARHALAIDETRSDFARVQWGHKGEKPERPAGEPEWLQQLWFAGVHSDIGGSYAEDESRLSDISLGWMVGEAASMPHELLVARDKLHLFPDPGGMQHSEVARGLEKWPRWWPQVLRITWKERPRAEALGATWHPSVEERFKLPAVTQYAEKKPYRPETLRCDPRVAGLY